METKKVKNNKEENNKDTRRRIILIIIAIIIIILLLITSCSCGSKFWGRIGNWFSNRGEYNVGEQDEKEHITNKDLKFDTDGLDITASDDKIKITFSVENINAKDYTCKTSDASIATCYIDKDGYVVLIPKKPGHVTVTIQTESNGKIYEATTEVTINESSRNIILESTSGSINLNQNKTIRIKYTLKGISGNVNVVSSDESIAIATISNGILKITGRKPGKATITLSVDYNNRTYTASYIITVTENPNTPNIDVDSNNLLKSITTNKGKLTPSFKSNIKNYTINLKETDKTITLVATANSKKAKVSYTYNGKTTNSFKDITMNLGTNEVTINVIAEDGKINKYIVTINKPASPNEPNNNKSNDATLKNIITTPSGLTPNFNKDTKEYKLDLNENQDKVTLEGIPSSSKSKVSYTYNGKTTDSFNNISLKPGTHKVIITITAEDGTTKDYIVTINKPEGSKEPDNDKNNDATLQNLIAKPRNLNPLFNKGTDEYKVELEADDANITLEGTPSSNKSKVEYIYNGNKTNTFNNKSLEAGTHIVKVLVTAEDGTQKTYTVTITKPEKKSNDTSISKVIVNGNAISYENGKYQATVGPNDSITIEVKPHDSKAIVESYTYTDKDGKEIIVDKFTNIDLPAGAHTVNVTIKAEDGTTNIYPIEITKPSIYKLEINSNDKSFNCYLENKECTIRYSITKDGESYTEYDPKDVLIELPEKYKDKISVDSSSKGEIILNIKDTTDLLNEELEVNLKYQDSVETSKIKFVSNSYTLSVNPKEYYAVLNDEKIVALYTDMFIKQTADGKNGFSIIKDAKKIRIESNNDKNIFIEISTSSDLINLDCTAKEDDFNSLPIKILTGNTEGKAYITVTGSVFGNKITNTTLEISIINKYLLTLDANGGIFIGTTDLYQYKISATDTLYLNEDEYKEAVKKDPSLNIGVPAIPTKVDSKDCFKIHEFIGYALKSNIKDYKYEEKDILFTSDKNNVSESLRDKVKTTINYEDLDKIGTNEVILVAVYKESAIDRDFTEEKEMWLVDVPLFHNEEYYKKHGEDKVIYPGASGEYTMYFKNTTNDPIQLTSFTLKEDTICFDEGCLNMGYIVKDSSNNYIFGASNEYWLLNGNSKYDKNSSKLVVPDGSNSYKLVKTLSEDLILTPNTDKDWAEITIHWRWVEFDRTSDILDTKIGNYAAKNNLNTLYKLSVGIKYKVLATTCENSKKD